jgi:hypothetical protein
MLVLYATQCWFCSAYLGVYRATMEEVLTGLVIVPLIDAVKMMLPGMPRRSI